MVNGVAEKLAVVRVGNVVKNLYGLFCDLLTVIVHEVLTGSIS